MTSHEWLIDHLLGGCELDLLKQNTMPLMKTPTSFVSEIEVLVRRIWTRARIRRMCSRGTPPDACTSPATRLPLELVKIIIAYLFYDMRSLRACTLTCYSWYTAAVPHLHRTLTIKSHYRIQNSLWPNPLRRMNTLGLLPLVKSLWVCGCNNGNVGPSTMPFDHRTLCQVSALTNVQELEVEYLDIPNLIPRIQRYFKHFLPRLRSLGLMDPRGSDRQIIYFIGFFQHLQDLRLMFNGHHPRKQPVIDLTLVPLFVPPLLGRLRMCCTTVGLVKGMIELFKGIRFEQIKLFHVEGMPLLLAAGAETLKSLALTPDDPYAGSYTRDFDLSRNKSLHTLQLPALSIDGSPGTIYFLKYVLSTLTPSACLKIRVLYEDRYFYGVGPRWPQSSKAKREKEASRHHLRFEVLREMHKVRGFQLELCASVWGRSGEEPVRMLEEAIAEEEAKGGFDEYLCKPLVMYNPQQFYQRYWSFASY